MVGLWGSFGGSGSDGSNGLRRRSDAGCFFRAADSGRFRELKSSGS